MLIFWDVSLPRFCIDNKLEAISLNVMKLNFWGAIEAATGDAMHHIFLVVLENNPPYFCSPPPITGTLTCHQRPPWNNKRKQTVKLWNFFFIQVEEVALKMLFTVKSCLLNFGCLMVRGLNSILNEINEKLKLTPVSSCEVANLR